VNSSPRDFLADELMKGFASPIAYKIFQMQHLLSRANHIVGALLNLQLLPTLTGSTTAKKHKDASQHDFWQQRPRQQRDTHNRPLDQHPHIARDSIKLCRGTLMNVQRGLLLLW